MVNNSNGRAYIAGWIIKLLAAAFLAGTIAWASNISTVNSTQDVNITRTQERVDSMKEQLNRIENKLDKIRR